MFDFDRVIRALPLLVLGPLEGESQRRLLSSIDRDIDILHP